MGKFLFFFLNAFLWVSSCSAPIGEKISARKNGQTDSVVKSFLPENDYHERNYYQNGEVSEDDFNAILAAAYELYSPIIESFGARLIVNGDYRSNTVNAYANQDGNEWSISFFGGLAKHPKMTFSGFVIVVCHELAHHLGGYPYYSNSPWNASVEGQSDYFATASCAKRMFDSSSPLRIWGFDLWKNRNPTESGNCNSFGLDRNVCELSLAGGLSLGAVLADLGNEREPSYSTPSKTVVKKTMEKHPNAQCRLDTYRIGALCNRIWDDYSMPRNRIEAEKISCQKPKCWYAG